MVELCKGRAAFGISWLPGVINAHAEIYGDANHIGMQVKGDDVTMSFPEVFSEVWEFDAVSGELLLFFKQGYASVRGSNVKAVDGRTISPEGLRPVGRKLVSTSESLCFRSMISVLLRHGVLFKLNPRLRQWLQAPLAGDFSD